MPFYPPTPGPEPYQGYPGFYPPEQAYPPYAQPYQQEEGFFPPSYGVQPFTPYRHSGLRQEPYYFPESYPPMAYGNYQRPSMWSNLNQIFAHAGEISNGIHTLRQLGSIFNSPR